MGADGNGLNDAFYKEVLNRQYANVCITDLETDRIIYMNDRMKKVFNTEKPEGKPCWEVFQKNMEGRCSFCRLEKLKAGEKLCVWNVVNTLNGHVYRNYDRLVEWEGKVYHVQSAVDITRYDELAGKADFDELTGILNRRAGKDKLADLIELARQEQKTLSVVLYDINQLKQINNTYGHSEGDRLLQYIVKLTKQNLDGKDFMFRLSGDEFLLVLYGGSKSDAESCMDSILEELRQKKEKARIHYELSFSFGVTMVYPGDTDTVSDIISRADEQMYLQKRRYHIAQAQEKAAVQKQEDMAGPFQFDKEHLYEALSAGTDDYIFVGNMKTGTFRYPAAMVEEFGLPGEVVPNAAAVWGPLIHPNDNQVFLESNQEIADGRAEYHNIEYRAKNVYGEWIWLRCRGRMIRDENGQPSLFAGMIMNLGKKNMIDHMTGLYNRYEFEGTVKRHMVDDGGKNRMGIMLLDMDSFKRINDLYDRSFGDEVLRITAQKISSLLPANARIYRMDGDEFAVLFLNHDAGDAVQIFDKIRSRFHKRQEWDGKKYYCTVSAGYASYPEDGDNYLELMKCANYSLEHSKLKGKNRLTAFSRDILWEMERRLELTELLRESIERGFVGFSVNYQPQVDAKTGKLYGAEALARWTCSEYGAVSSGEFIPLLEQSGMILQLGAWVFDRAAEQCKKWCIQKPDFKMSINVSYLQLLKGDIVSYVREALQKLALSPANIILELTETYLIKEDEETDRILEELHKIGIKLAMDDFGMGYSSLLSLKNVPVDVVKIDRGFIQGITVDPFNAAFIRAITELCRNVGKEVCLEGVEVEEEYSVVCGTGIELIQGFYFGRPVVPEQFDAIWLPGEE